MKRLSNKTIIFTYEFGLSSDGYGGGQTILLSLIREYLKKHFTVYLITPKTSNVIEEFKNLKCFIIYSKKYDSQIYTSLSLAKSFFNLINKFPHLDHSNFKVLSFTSEAFLCLIICKIKNIKFYTYLAAPKIPELSYFINLLNIKKNILLILFLLGAKFSRKCFCISNFILNELKKKYNFKNLANVNCGIHNKFLSFKYKNTEQNNKINLLYVGRLALKQKPIHLIIESLENINSLGKFYVAGSGPDKNILLEMVRLKKLERKVIFLGNLNENSIIKYSKKCQIAILVSNYESFMITAYEMAALVRKLVLSDVADLKKRFSKFKGIAFIKNSKKDIIKTVNSMQKIKISNYDLGIRKNFLNKKFTWAKVYEEIEKY